MAGAVGGAYAPDFFWLGERDSVPRLANMPAIQNDIGLSAEQKDAVKAVIEEVRAFEARMPKEVPPTPMPSLESVEAAKRAAAQTELVRAGAKIARLLSPAQAERLEQIRLQYAGTEALFRPEVVRALGISREQQQSLARIRNKANTDVAALQGPTSKRAVNPPPNSAAPQSEGEIIRSSDRRMLEGVLTAEQQAKLKELKGAPVAFEPKYGPDMTLGATSGGSGGTGLAGPPSAGRMGPRPYMGQAGGRKPGAGGGAQTLSYFPLGSRGSVPRLASLAGVRKELRLSDQQSDAVKVIVQRLREFESRLTSETFQTQVRTPPSELNSLFAARDKELTRERQQARQQIVRLLTAAQAKRLDQISLQDAGAETLFRPEVIQVLGISREQQNKLAGMQRKAKEEVAAIYVATIHGKGNQPPGDGASQSLAEIVGRLDRQIVEAVLSAGQQAKLSELRGAPFAFPAGYRPAITIQHVAIGSGGGSGSRPR